MSTIGRKVERPASGESSVPQKRVSSAIDEENWPGIWKFLHNERKTDEFAKTGSLGMFIDGETTKLWLNDRPNRQSAFITGSSFGDVFREAETQLQQGSVNWRKKGYKRRSRAKVYV